MPTDKHIERLHYLTQDGIPDADHAELARAACLGGIGWLQLRMKSNDENLLLETALAVKKITERFNCTLIINDHISLAKAIGADGVHLGKNDMPVKEARSILGENKIIGGTANTKEDILKLVEDGADYIGLGPFRFTATKENLSPILGIDGIRELVKIQTTVPVIIIGGLQLEDINTILGSGAYGVAVSSAINIAKDRSLMAKQFIDKVSIYSGEKDAAPDSIS